MAFRTYRPGGLELEELEELDELEELEELGLCFFLEELLEMERLETGGFGRLLWNSARNASYESALKCLYSARNFS